MNHKILIIGKNSFIGKSLHQHFGWQIVSRDELNLLKFDESFKFLTENKFDIIINCAISGTAKNTDTLNDLYNNILLFENLLLIQEKLKFKLITFSSGAEFDRRGPITGQEGKYDSVPTDFYGLAKYTHSKRIENNANILNLRIFNVFGPLERSNRFIYSCFISATKHQNIEIYEDKKFDFFSIYDLMIFIANGIKNNLSGEYNCVYEKKNLISETANEIIKITGSKSIINIHKSGNNDYIGCSKKIKTLKLPLWELRKSLELYANQLA